MIDIHGEQLVLLKDAAKIVPGRPHLATLYRWADEKAGGFRGVVLETVPIGSKRFTSKEALQRFAEAVKRKTSGQAIPTPSTRASRDKRRDVAAAQQVVRSALHRPRRKAAATK